MSERLPSYGGQAVLEGVMMRGTRACAVAVRAPDASIVIDTRPLGGLYRSRWARVPLLRGLLLLWDALALGMRALTFSANVQAGDEQLSPTQQATAMAVAVAGGLSLFFLLPAGVGYLAERLLGAQAWAANLIEGLTRLGLLVGYVAAIGLLPDIRRVYGYHGAEHKTINAFEAGAPLTVEDVASFPREHVRCGTSFLLTVVVLSVLLFSLLGPLPLLPRLLSRLALIPVLAALAYEYLRLSARLARFAWARPLLAPNLALQRLTTREPDPAMIEVALAAFEAMRAQESESAPSPA